MKNNGNIQCMKCMVGIENCTENYSDWDILKCILSVQGAAVHKQKMFMLKTKNLYAIVQFVW